MAGDHQVFTRKSFVAMAENKVCKNCIVAKYPPCNLGIPCCYCEETECNGRQPCPRKEK